ncbi:hypothetical protein J1614_004086 [Plenodomus biglobosus]|nr:hypothetical protein J1614_004086 [Plenodomus biglobosus]
MELHNLNDASSEQIFVGHFYNRFRDSSATLSSPTPAILQICFCLYALYTLDQFASSFTTTTAVSPESVYDL